MSSSGWARANCPMCELRTGKPDRKRCLGLRVGSGFWHCLRCHAAGRVRDMPEDLSSLAPPEKEREDAIAEVPLPEEFLDLYVEPHWSDFTLAAFRDYVRSDRGIADDVAYDLGIGACLDGRYSNRVLVPIWSPPDEIGNRISFGFSARSVSKHAFAKYLYPPELRRGEVLFNAEALLVETDEPAFVGEGVFDGIELWPDGVACLGKPTEEQIDALCAAKRPLVVMLDGDAWREAEALSLRLRFEGLRAGYLRLPPTTDPPKVGCKKIREQARDALIAP